MSEGRIMSNERRGWGPLEGDVLSVTAPTGTHLQNLALQANAAHGACYPALEQTKASLARAKEYAVDAGKALTEARQNVPHGQWEPWLAAHCPQISSQRASEYTRYYEASVSGALAQIPAGGDLGLKDVIKLLGPANAAPGRATKAVKKVTTLTVGRALGKTIRASALPGLHGARGNELRRMAIRGYLSTLKGKTRETMEYEFVEWGTAMLDELADAD
jgi:hypothetical protein